VQFVPVDADPMHTLLPPDAATADLTKVSVFLEVEGAAHYLPAYAGNLDIMTSAALRVGEQIAQLRSSDLERAAR
jgi:acetaldehyde dehydrogenase